MSLLTLGISHQTAPISIRDRIAFAVESMPDALASLASLSGVDGCSILSTCNRTELYISSQQTITRSVFDWLHDWHQLTPSQFQDYFYRLEHGACNQHLIKVISGMDSMVLGEPQVAGQARQAWQLARDAQTLDSFLDRMFQHAFAAAKRVRSETGIGRDPVTLPYAAVRLARQIFGRLDGLNILLIGAGEMIEDCATHFHTAGLDQLTIANRSVERAQRLASRFKSRAVGLDAIPQLLSDHDLVIACTGSPTAVVNQKMFRDALRQRRRRPMFALDLSVPRNISSDSASLDDLYLYTIDDLRQIIDSAQKKRQSSLQEAGSIVAAEVASFERWLRVQNAADTLKTMRRDADIKRRDLLSRAQRELAAGASPEAVLNKLSNQLTNRLLHKPSVRLRQAAESNDLDLLDAARYYFVEGKEDDNE